MRIRLDLLALLSLLLAAGCPGDDAGSGPAPGQLPSVVLPAPLSSSTPQAPPTPAPRPAEQPDVPWLRLFYVQSNQGEVDPCGCPGSPNGGAARRARWVQLLRQGLPDALVLEGPAALGSAPLGPEAVAPKARRRGRNVLELLPALDVDAWFPGRDDFAVIAPGELFRAAAPLPVVVSNLPGAPRASLVVERDGRRVLLLGLLAPPRSQAGQELAAAEDAVEAARRELARAVADGPVDAVVAFTDAGDTALGDWLDRDLPVDVVLQSASDRKGAGPRWEAGRYVVRAHAYGRVYDRLDLALTGPVGRGLAGPRVSPLGVERVAAMEARYLDQQVSALTAEESAVEQQRLLDDALAQRTQYLARVGPEPRGHLVFSSHWTVLGSVPPDPAVAARVDAWNGAALDTLERDLARERPTGAQRYAGQDLCLGACHEAGLFAHWARGPHARAWKSLVDRGETRNVECLPCHTTGFGEPGGFADPDIGRHLLNVQCEACHGPMLEHAATEESAGKLRPHGRAIDEGTCRRCHDDKNSPAFDYATYSAQVEHPR